MFHLDLPNVYKVLNNGTFKLDETVTDTKGEGSFKDVRSQPIVVVSIFGSTWNQAVRGSRFKRAFQLALNGFGTISLYDKDGARGKAEEKESAEKDKEVPSIWGEDKGSLEGEKPEGKESDSVRESKEKEEGGEQKGDHFHLNAKASGIGGTLEGFFNEDESVLFLHIEGLAYDTASCMEACQELRSLIRESSFLSVCSTFNSSYCKWLLLLFSMSHIMIMSETGNSFDTSYISLFRALDAVRQDVLPSISKILSTIEGLPKWVDHARLCSPRLLFLFEIETENPIKIQNISSVISCPVKEQKELLQNEIYQIFRKCRIITNISANSLFAIPASEDFVFVFDKSAQNSFSTNQSLAYTYLNWIGMSAKKATLKPIPTASRTSSNTALPVKMSFRAHQNSLTYNDTINSFRSFLMEHIAVALERGFDDDYRRVSGSKHFFVRPKIGQWEVAYKKLYQHIILEPTSRRISGAYLHMEKLINVDLEYLEIQCADLFPKVYATYQRGLPEFYTAQQHQTKLTYAVNVFLNISRGPGVLPWLKKLANKCEKYWKNGRQQCETLNLLGHVCANPTHRVRRQDHLEIIPLPELDEDLPEMQHNSSTRLVSYCNCGKRQGSREEPFTIRDANYEFYRKLGKDCCDKFEAYNFSVFSTSEESRSELSLQEMLVILQKKSESISSLNNLQEKSVVNAYDLASPELPEVFESELRQEDGLEDESEESEVDEGIDDANNDKAFFTSPDSEKSETLSLSVQENAKAIEEPRQLCSSVKLKHENGMTLSDRRFSKRSSTIEYLPGMYHSKSPAGLLSLFPSWSLLCLGPSSIYSHSHGVHQPGFLNGANALLPWDVKVKAHEGVTFAPPPRVLRGRRQNPRRSGTNKTTPSDEFSVKVFFGYEYECRKGHRFFCDSDTVLYALNYSAVTQKSIAGKVIASDMPLYIYCPCKENRDVKQIAQLIRIHVVTPKAPVFVALNPKVQPGPMGTCPIFLSGEDLIKLTPSTYWILRLPFSYVGEVVYVPPIDVKRYNGRVLKGTFDVISMNPSETEEWEKQNQARQ